MSLGRFSSLTCSTPPRVVQDQASSLNDTATITATNPIKIRPPGVPIIHIGSLRCFHSSAVLACTPR